MRLPWLRRRLLITERRFSDLRRITRAILRGVGLGRRIREIVHLRSLKRFLDDALRLVNTPRRVLLVAHGARGRLVAAQDGKLNKYVDSTWWGSFDPDVELFVFGCESASFVSTYGLDRRCRHFLGFREKVRFYLGSPLGRRAMREVCAFVGESFVTAEAIDPEFAVNLQQKYDHLIRETARTPSDFGRRLILIELERQLESLQCTPEASQ